MAPYPVDAGDLAELREGRLLVTRARDPWTEGPVFARIVSYNTERVQYDEIRRQAGQPDELVRWDVALGEFFAKVFDRWHDDALPPAPPPTGGYRLPLHPRRDGRRTDH